MKDIRRYPILAALIVYNSIFLSMAKKDGKIVQNQEMYDEIKNGALLNVAIFLRGFVILTWSIPDDCLSSPHPSKDA